MKYQARIFPGHTKILRQYQPITAIDVSTRQSTNGHATLKTRAQECIKTLQDPKLPGLLEVVTHTHWQLIPEL